MDIEADTGPEDLDLTEEQEVAFPEDLQESDITAEDEPEETVVFFGDEPDESVDETPLVRRLREQLRQAQRQNKQRSAPSHDSDPEPVIPPAKRIDDPEFDYDPDRHDEYCRKRDAQVEAHAEWKVRQSERVQATRRAEQEQAKQVEQQVRALGVSDYAERSETVRDRLSNNQMAVLLNATDNPAKLVYALGRSETRLDELASIDNLARFAARIGQLERDIKVTKRKAPPPVSTVRGATASTAITNDAKELERLEREAEKTGDRSKIIAYRRQLRKNAA